MTTFLSVLIDFTLAAAIAYGLARLVKRQFGGFTVTAEHRVQFHVRVTRLIRLISVLAFGVATVVAVSLIRQQFGIGNKVWTPRELAEGAFAGGVRILIIIVAAVLFSRFAHLAIEQVVHRIGHRYDNDDLEWQRRASTLALTLGRLTTLSVVFVAGLMVLEELSINIMPVLTGAGIAGLAIGFGAQNLVRDMISGFFLILEDQVRIGDVARINTVTGRVENINLRTLVIRDSEGAVHVFPNGTITALANMSKQFAYAVVDVRISYRADIDHVLQVIRDVGAEMRRDAKWSPLLLEPLEVNGVESLRDGFPIVRMRFMTPPLEPGNVASELRRRIMIAFASNKIGPFAH